VEWVFDREKLGNFRRSTISSNTWCVRMSTWRRNCLPRFEN